MNKKKQMEDDKEARSVRRHVILEDGHMHRRTVARSAKMRAGKPGSCPSTAKHGDPHEFQPGRAVTCSLQSSSWLAVQLAAGKSQRLASDLERARACGHLSSATPTTHQPEWAGRCPECLPAPIPLPKGNDV